MSHATRSARRRKLHLSWVLLLVALGPACDQHDPYCEGTVVMCVEDCDTGAFVQCGGCPEGSMPVEDCAADGGR